MNKSRLIAILLVIFLIADTAFSFIQYYNTPLMGDLEVSVWPDELVQRLFDDPFGFEVLKTGEKQFNPNRYFSHLFLKDYFRNVPLFFQRFVNPVSSVYLTAAFAKIFIQILLIFIIAFFVTNKKFWSKQFFIATILIVPLFQAYGFWSRMGILDRSIAYTFFYGGPLVFAALFFLPIFNQIQNQVKIKKVWYFILIPLIVVLPFTGPLNPPVIVLVSFFIYLSYWLHADNRNILKKIKNIPISIHSLLIPISLLSLYSLFLGMYDASFSSEVIPIIERYKHLPAGIWSQLFHSAAFPLLLLFTGINIFAIHKNNYPEKEKLKRALIWIGIFSFVYILLLPIGGYRPYRPNIIRYDTFIPVNISLFYLFCTSAYAIITNTENKKRKFYLSGTVVFLIFLTASDFKGIGKNKCEIAAFDKMASSDKKIVPIPKGCFVLDWADQFDYTKTESKAELIHYWRITPEKKLFYNKQQ